jgi:hypothetical protein
MLLQGLERMRMATTLRERVTPELRERFAS